MVDERIHLQPDVSWLIDLVRKQVWEDSMPFSKGIDMLVEGIHGVTKASATRILTGSETIKDGSLVTDTKETEYLEYIANKERKDLQSKVLLSLQLFPYRYFDKFAAKMSCQHFEDMMGNKHITYDDIRNYFSIQDDPLINCGLYSINQDFVLKPVESEADQEEFYEYLYEYWQEYLASHTDIPDETRRRIEIRQYNYERYRKHAEEREDRLDSLIREATAKRALERKQKDFTVFTHDTKACKYLPMKDSFYNQGLISPIGDFYACDFACHAGAAKYLLEQSGYHCDGLSIDEAKDLLFDRGWVFVNPCGGNCSYAPQFLFKTGTEIKDMRTNRQAATAADWKRWYEKYKSKKEGITIL